MLNVNRKRRQLLCSAGLAALATAAAIPTANGAAAPVTATYTGTGTGTQSWSDGTSWSSNPDFPSGVGAGAIFNGPTASRNIQIQEADPITLGSISQNSDTNFNSTISAATGGSLTFDAVDAGPATITVSGTGTGNLALSAPSSFTDSVLAIVNQTSASSGAGTLNWTGSVTGGAGGFTKQGPGVLTFGTATKQYEGPTLFDTDSGRIRISVSGRPSRTSSVTVMPGAQIEFITDGTYTMGPGPLNLNGTGLGAGSTPGHFPGAIRPATNRIIDIANEVVLQSDTLIHVQGAATGSTTLSGTVSGPGALTFISPLSDNNLGKLVLGAANTYTGGTIVNGGTLEVTDGAGLGTGPLQVNSGIPGWLIPTTVNLSTTGPTTIGSLSGSSVSAAGSTQTINNGGQNLTVNQAADGTFIGTVAGAGGFGLGAASTSTLNLTTPQSYTGATMVEGGTLALATDLTNSASVSVTGGVLRLTPAGTRVIRAAAVAASGTGKIDLTDNKLITGSPLGSFDGSAYTGITGLITSGRGSAGGNAQWNGATGITTSDARAIDTSNRTSLGVIDASDKFRQPGGAPIGEADTALFAGQTVTGAETLVMFTWGGDANLDGRINIDDYGRIDSNVGTPGAHGWANGDFNYDGKINIDDYGIIDSNISQQGGVVFPTSGGVAASAAMDGVAAVPEPASLALVALSAAGLLRRRRAAR